jgi:hypothetical protein
MKSQLWQRWLSGIWKKHNHSNEVIFQYEITSKKFHQRESFHQERSLNTVPIVHWLPNYRNLYTNTVQSLNNIDWKLFELQITLSKYCLAGTDGWRKRFLDLFLPSATQVKIMCTSYYGLIWTFFFIYFLYAEHSHFLSLYVMDGT